MLPGNLVDGEADSLREWQKEKQVQQQVPIQWSFPFGFAQGQDDEIFGGASEEQMQQQLQQQIPFGNDRKKSKNKNNSWGRG